MKKALLALLILSLTGPLTAAPQDPITEEQTVICLSPEISNYPRLYNFCKDVIKPYICGIWLNEPFVSPPHSPYIVPWNQECRTNKVLPPG